jgi:hypothetical protein
MGEVDINDAHGRAAVIVPDYCTPLIGYRMWRLHTASLLLGSMNWDCEWQPRTAIAARCMRTLLCPRHAAPDRACTCGIYAYRDKLDLQRASGVINRRQPHRGRWRLERALPVDTLVLAFGEAYLWGRIEVHANGYRAEFAYPKSLWTWDPATTEGLCRIYAIPPALELACVGTREKGTVDESR